MMNDHPSRKKRLIRRLRYLWTFELLDSFLLPAVVILSSLRYGQPLGLFSIYSSALVTWLLWQGAAYWWLKLQAVRSDGDIAGRHLRPFAKFKSVNWVLIGLLPLLLLGNALLGNPFRSTLDVVAGLGMAGLAVLEQVNYYHVQLMYDYPPDWRYLIEKKRLKRSSLSRALERLGSEGEDSI
jgi:hypothetical protein